MNPCARIGLALCLALQVHATVAQVDSARVRYTAGFVFHEGLYLSFRAFRNNTPTFTLEQLRTDQGRPITDLRATNGRLTYADSTGATQKLDLSTVWGFCNGGVVYVRAGDGFCRIGLMGSLAHLTFDATYRNWDSFSYGGSIYTVEEQRLLDMNSGAFLPVTGGGIRAALQHDPELLGEFDALPKRDRNATATVFEFVRRYNDRHPLYFPD